MGSKQQNGHVDVLVQCLLPGCMASDNNIRNEGITRSGGGSALTPSICNFTKHYDKDGYDLNFEAWPVAGAPLAIQHRASPHDAGAAKLMSNFYTNFPPCVVLSSAI